MCWMEKKLMHKILADNMKHWLRVLAKLRRRIKNNVALFVFAFSLTCPLSDTTITRTKVPQTLLHSFSQHAVWRCGDNLSGAASTLKLVLTADLPTVFPRSLYGISDSYTSSLPLHLFLCFTFPHCIVCKVQQALLSVSGRVHYTVMKSEIYHFLRKPWKQPELSCKAWRPPPLYF